jgi:hypothetical protein
MWYYNLWVWFCSARCCGICCFSNEMFWAHVSDSFNRTIRIKHHCRKATVFSCHWCLINASVSKMSNISNFDHQMSLSKRKCWYSNNCLHFLKLCCSFVKIMLHVITTCCLIAQTRVALKFVNTDWWYWSREVMLLMLLFVVDLKKMICNQNPISKLIIFFQTELLLQNFFFSPLDKLERLSVPALI